MERPGVNGWQRMTKYTTIYFCFILMRQDEGKYRGKNPVKI